MNGTWTRSFFKSEKRNGTLRDPFVPILPLYKDNTAKKVLEIVKKYYKIKYYSKFTFREENRFSE